MEISNKAIELLNICFDMLEPLFKYKNNDARELLIDDVIAFMFEILKPSAKTYCEVTDLLEKAFDFECKEDYLNYKLVNPEDEILTICSKYFHLLENEDNLLHFNTLNFKEDLYNSTMNGNRNAIMLKAALLAIGNVWSKNEPLAIKHFEYCAYSGSLICFDFIAGLDTLNKDNYLNIKNKITYCIENLITDLSSLNFSEEEKNEIKIFFNLFNSYKTNKVINLQLAYMSLEIKHCISKFGFTKKGV